MRGSKPCYGFSRGHNFIPSVWRAKMAKLEMEGYGEGDVIAFLSDGRLPSSRSMSAEITKEKESNREAMRTYSVITMEIK